MTPDRMSNITAQAAWIQVVNLLSYFSNVTAYEYE